MSDQELERALRDLGAHLEHPATPPLAEAVTARLRAEPAAGRPQRRSAMLGGLARWPTWRRLAVAGVAAVLAAAAVLTVSPAARDAAARALGLRGVRIRLGGPAPATTTPPPGAGAGLQLGRRISLDEAQRMVGFRALLPTVADLGRPDAVYVGEPPPGGQIALVYQPRPGLPASALTGVGLLITEFRGAVPSNRGDFEKITREGGRVEQVTVNGEPGYWLTGKAHFFLYVDSAGRLAPDTVRLAGDTLVWEDGELTLRLEGEISKQEALRLANSMR
jgi:Domain of unknown function (DUF4367)